MNEHKAKDRTGGPDGHKPANVCHESFLEHRVHGFEREEEYWSY